MSLQGWEKKESNLYLFTSNIFFGSAFNVMSRMVSGHHFGFQWIPFDFSLTYWLQVNFSNVSDVHVLLWDEGGVWPPGAENRMRSRTSYTLGMCMSSCMLVLQSCPALYNTVGCSPPDSSSVEFSRQVYWRGLPLPFSRELTDPGMNHLSYITCIDRHVLPLAPPGKPTLGV